MGLLPKQTIARSDNNFVNVTSTSGFGVGAANFGTAINVGDPQVTFGDGNVAQNFFERELQQLSIVGSFLANPLSPPTPTPSPVSRPETAPTNVFNSISLVDQYVLQAADGIRGLRLLFGDAASGSTETSLTAALEEYLDDYMTGEAATALFPDRAEELGIYFPQDIQGGSDNNPDAPPRFSRFTFNNTALTQIEAAVSPNPTTGRIETTAQTLHTNLFAAGRVMLDDSRAVQRLRHGLTRLQRRRESDLSRARRELVELRTEIAAARRDLSSLNGVRLEAAGDAQAAQGLLVENWSATEAAFEARRRALEDNEGLAFVRVRESPVALPLPDPLPLRPDTGGRFPWAGRIPGDIPEVLEPFFEAIQEIPLADWAGLHPMIHFLPAPGKLRVLHQRRDARLQSVIAAPVQQGSTVIFQRLAPVQILARNVVADFARQTYVAAPSIREQQRNSAETLALNDLVIGGPAALRQPAAVLRDSLEQALLGMLGLLRQLPGGVRLAWGEAAEADRLVVRDPARWPALETVRETEFNTLRSLFEVVDWWFDQLRPQARSGSQTAMNAMIRSVLLLAADDDPSEILQGSVRVAIPRLLPGAILRLALNRRARPGAVLHLMDPTNAVVGLLRVDDEDAGGVSATVTQTLVGSLPVDSNFTVIEQRLSAWE